MHINKNPGTCGNRMLTCSLCVIFRDFHAGSSSQPKGFVVFCDLFNDFLVLAQRVKLVGAWSLNIWAWSYNSKVMREKVSE